MEDVTIPKELLIYVPVFFALAKGIKFSLKDDWSKIANHVPLASFILGGITGIIVGHYDSNITMQSSIIGGALMGFTTVGMNETLTGTLKKKT